MKAQKEFRKNEILTIPEVAEMLSLTPLTVWKHAKAGKLPAYQVGREWRFSRKAIMLLIEGTLPTLISTGKQEKQEG